MDASRPSHALELRALLVLAAILLAWSWTRVAGYQLADEIEYLERARQMSRGDQVLDSTRIRAFGFSLPWVPLFWVADLLELAPRRVLWCARLAQIALTLALLAACARLAARVVAGSLGPRASRGAGSVAAGLLLASPVVLRWGVVPIADVAAALCVALAIDALLAVERRGPRARGLACGAWLGLSLLAAYKTLLVIAPLVLLALWRERCTRGLRPALLGAFTAAVLLQCLLDLAYYGAFGASLGRYVVENFGSQFAILLFHVGRFVGSSTVMDAAGWVYNHASALHEPNLAYQEFMKSTDAAVPSMKGPLWYLRNLPQALPWPAIALLAAGLVACVARPAWPATLLALVVLLNVLVMSVKGAKDFRLWLPILPLLAALAGLGFGALAALLGERRRALARAAGAALVAVALVLGARAHAASPLRSFGAYWRAMEFVNARAAQAPGRPRAASAFHWAVFLRESRGVELIKLPLHLDGWERYDARQRARDLEAIARLDWLVLHVPTLHGRPDLLAAVAEDFAVAAAFYEREHEARAGPGPVLVLARRAGREGELVLAQARPARWGPGDPEPLATFREPEGGAVELLAYRCAPLPGDGHGWLETTWRGGGLAQDYTFVQRITGRDGPHAWQDNHAPGWGLHPTSSWGAGLRLREGYLVIAEADAFRAAGERRFLGGAWRRGELAPADLWVAVDRYGAGGLLARLDSRAHGVDEAPRSEDGLLWIGPLALPVPRAARLPLDAPGRAP